MENLNFSNKIQKETKKSGSPDGVEAWCVALSACFINFVLAGLGRMSGILYVAFIEIFLVNRLQASIPFSARSLARNLFGPVVGILGQKYGVRTTTLIGGIIGTLSAILCFYTHNIIWITILWGVFNGAGAALSMTLPQVVLNQHFEKHRTTASGMAFSGGCVGSFLFPALLEYLLYSYGLQGSFLILGGIIMNVIPASMILRKPSWMKKHAKKNTEVTEKQESIKCNFNDENFQNKSNQNEKKKINRHNEHFTICKNVLAHKISELKDFSMFNTPITTQIDIEFLRDNRNLFLKLLKNIHLLIEDDSDNIFSALPDNILQKYFEDLCTFSETNIKDHSSLREVVLKESAHDCSTFSKSQYVSKDKKISEKETVLSAATLKTSYDTECYNYLSVQIKKIINNDIKRIESLFSEEEWTKISIIMEQMKQMFNESNGDGTDNSLKDTQNDNKLRCKDNNNEHPNTFKAHIKAAIRLHKNPLFLLISFSRSVHFLTFVPAMTIIVDFSMDKGLLEADGKYVIAAISFGDLVGRLCLGWITDREFLSLPRYMFLVMVLQGACTAALSLMFSKLTLLSTIALFGLLQGSLFVRHPVLVSKYLGSHEQSVAMGCFNFFSGLLGFALPNYIGYFRDTVGSYDYIFYINGLIGLLVGIMWFFEPYLVKCGDPVAVPIQESC